MDYLLPLFTFAFAIACVVLMVVVLKRDAKGIRSAYSYLSLMHGLRVQSDYVSATPHPTAKGVYNGRELTIASKARFFGYRRRAYTLITVAAPEIGKDACTVTSWYPGAAMLTRKRILLHDEAFDAKFFVEGSSELALAILTAEVREQMLRAAKNDFSGSYSFANGRLEYEVLRLIHNDKRMHACDLVIKTLYRVAELLPRK